MNQQGLVGAVAAAANVEPHLAQNALAEEKNDANDAVFLSMKRQEEADLVAVQKGKAGQGAAQPAIPALPELWAVPPSLTLQGSCSGGGGGSSSSSSSRARSTTTRRRMRCSARELPATRRWPNPRAIPRARVQGGALDG
jgi:hypothetical protein